jgi:hypothetical protein
MSNEIDTRMSRRWAWINGWGVPADVFTATVHECWPQHTHIVFAPDRQALVRVRAAGADLVAGYSLGALLLLSDDTWPASLPLVAVAPFLAFDAEVGLGGMTAAATREMMRKKFDRNPSGMLRLFQRMAGLPGLVSDPLPYAVEELAWGLDALGTLRAAPGTVRRTRCYTGTRDPLLSAEQLALHIDALHLIEGAGHDFHQLLPAVASHE